MFILVYRRHNRVRVNFSRNQNICRAEILRGMEPVYQIMQINFSVVCSLWKQCDKFLHLTKPRQPSVQKPQFHTRPGWWYKGDRKFTDLSSHLPTVSKAWAVGGSLRSQHQPYQQVRLGQIRPCSSVCRLGVRRYLSCEQRGALGTNLLNVS